MWKFSLPSKSFLSSLWSFSLPSPSKSSKSILLTPFLKTSTYWHYRKSMYKYKFTLERISIFLSKWTWDPSLVICRVVRSVTNCMHWSFRSSLFKEGIRCKIVKIDSQEIIVPWRHESLRRTEGNGFWCPMASANRRSNKREASEDSNIHSK